MNTFLTNQLEDVKNDLKEIDSRYCLPIRRMTLRELVKTKLEKYHEWANEFYDYVEYANKYSVQISDNSNFDENTRDLVEELSTFISEVEKLAKENGVELK